MMVRRGCHSDMALPKQKEGRSSENRKSMANSRFTLANARTRFTQEIVPPPSGSTETLAQKFLRQLNEVCESATNGGQWRASRRTVLFDSSTGFIALDRRSQSILGVQINGFAKPVFSTFFEYLEEGNGEIDEDEGPICKLVDMGDGHCCRPFDSQGAGYLRLYFAVDADKTLPWRFFVVQADDTNYFDPATGFEGSAWTPATNPSTLNLGQAVKSVYELTKPVTLGHVTLKWVPAVASPSSAEVTLAVFEPSDTAPNFHLYKTGVQTQAIRALCQRRHIDFVNDTDKILPDNPTFLRHGLRAVNFEDQADEDRATKNWGMAYQALNGELKGNRGGAKVILRKQGMGHGMGRFTRVN